MILDRKYISLVSYKLRNFKQKNDNLFNFSCPFCGDSRKHRSKARGFLYRKGDTYYYKCHNCNYSRSFSNFLKEFDSNEFANYMLEKSGKLNVEVATKPHEEDAAPKMSSLRFDDVAKIIPSIDTLPPQHYARRYISERRIPEKFWNEIFYAEDFKKFIGKIIPDNDKELFNEPRVIIFNTDIEGNLTGVSGRSLLSSNKLRYINMKISDERKIFGLHRLDLKKRVYIVEGQFDSLFVDNCVASCDSNLYGIGEYLKENYSVVDTVLVYDIEPRNRELIKQITRSIEMGYTIALLPYSEWYKDINGMILNGNFTSAAIKAIIDDHSYSRLMANAELLKWRKV